MIKSKEEILLQAYETVLIEQYAIAKFKAGSSHPAHQKGFTKYWSGARDGYHRVLEQLYPGWYHSGRGAKVYLCHHTDEEILVTEEYIKHHPLSTDAQGNSLLITEGKC
mgnify:CR=1 FL=1